MDKPMKQRNQATIESSASAFCDIALSVLGFQEDEQWVALALEMDLRGYGQTFEEAVDDLRDLVILQIRFALFKDQPEMVWRPAEPVWFQLFAELRSTRLRSFGRPAAPEGAYQIGGLQLPPAQVFLDRQPDFALADA
ncbi:MAG TPA: hypothetical protein VOA87_12010 [Thermoanaerobaculia bacterium]|nr:hypothetical protein [Thermoanaerobaculia bacterium]